MGQGAKQDQEQTTCFHCALPTGPRPLLCQFGGELKPFCCRGCYLVQIITGRKGEGGSRLILMRLLVGVACGMVVMLFSWSRYGDEYVSGLHATGHDALSLMIRVYVSMLATIVMGALGIPILRDAYGELTRRRIGIDALIGLGAFSAYLISLYRVVQGGGDTYYDTATMILVFVTLGRYLEATGKARATEAIRGLRGLVPQTATVLGEQGEAIRPISEIKLGERVLVRPGEIIPVDGAVLDGTGNVNEAAVTGESRPVMREAGDRLLAGTLNLDGAFVVSVTALAPDRAIARLVELAEEAKRVKPAVMGLAERLARVFTPAVVLLSLGAFVFWTMRLGLVPGLFIALSVVLVACPCTLGIATPLAFWTALALAARRGILVRNGLVLERLARVRRVFFDKTGTLTQGSFQLVTVIAPALDGSVSPDALSPLQIAASLEARSEHPLAAALRSAASQQGLAALPVSDWKARPGIGVQARLNGKATEFFLGGERLMREAGLEMDPALSGAAAARSQNGESLVYLGWQGRAHAAFALGEEVRPEAGEALAALGRQGISVTVLTGDERGSAERLSRILRIEDVRPGLLPHEKVVAIRAGQGSHGAVAMVGDGINDAAALAAADVGIALGCGADVAREAGDVVMVSAGLTQLAWLFGFARRVRRVVAGNLVWAFAYNVIGVAVALSGHLPPVYAAMAMALSSLCVVGNTRRLYAGVGKPVGVAAPEESTADEIAGLPLEPRVTEGRGCGQVPAVGGERSCNLAVPRLDEVSWFMVR